MTANGDNFSAPAGIKFPRNLDALLDCGKESLWPQTSSDDQSADPVSDVNKPFDNFDFGRLLQENRCVQGSTSKHTSYPSPLTSEQRDVEPDFINQFNILTFGKVGFLPTVPFGRQTAEPVALRNAVAFPTLPEPANDAWHPLGAA